MRVEIGRVEAIYRYPVKSMAGERLDAAARDRLHAAITNLIDSQFGGSVHRLALTRLFLARRAP